MIKIKWRLIKMLLIRIGFLFKSLINLVVVYLKTDKKYLETFKKIRNNLIL